MRIIGHDSRTDVDSVAADIADMTGDVDAVAFIGGLAYFTATDGREVHLWEQRYDACGFTLGAPVVILSEDNVSPVVWQATLRGMDLD